MSSLEAGRKARPGLVGYAEMVGASKAVWQYLQTKQPIKVNMDALLEKMRSLGKPIVMKDDIRKLEVAETAVAQKRGLEAFKFNSNEEMLQAMGFMETV
jgi:hypothetical protein